MFTNIYFETMSFILRLFNTDVSNLEKQLATLLINNMPR